MPYTYNDLYFKIRTELKNFGVDAFSQEARILLAAACRKDKAELMRDMGLYVSDDIEKKTFEMLGRRLKGEPLAYIVGVWEFYGLPMLTTPDVLIPRMDTEVLAEAAIRLAQFRKVNKPRILDLCCGSGCIACALAKHIPDARVIAMDISEEALEVCKKNIKLNSLASNIIPVCADARKWPPSHTGAFDMIVCNPPYIRADEIPGLDVSVRDYEPKLALDGGVDGLDFYRDILAHWTIALRPNAFMLFEVGEGQADAVKTMLLEAGFDTVDSLLDTMGVERVVIGQWKNEY